ncbi:MAG: nucleotidyltransferase domain-containing protein, partial [Armatimonadetes bacterium]|nr:nucleotidyltransferase domain-containing protein [Armatimonadota bacterium]
MEYEACHRDRLLKHARRCASALQDDELVVGVLAGGSLAHGGTDRESDIDLFVIVRRLPSVETRARWLSAITGQGVDRQQLSGTDGRTWDEFDGPRDEPEQWMGSGGGLLYFTQEQIEHDMTRVAELLTAFSSRMDEYLADLAHGVVL